MLVIENYREVLEEGGHGDVHYLAHVVGEKRRGLLLCGRLRKGMRKQTTPFRGSNTVTCARCTDLLTVISDAMEGELGIVWERIMRYDR